MNQNLSSFFIDRPIFASVIALFITLLGAFALRAPLLGTANFERSTSFPAGGA